MMNLFSLGTALTPTLFFEVFSMLPIFSEISEKFYVRALKTFFEPLVVMLFWVRSRWMIELLFLITLMRDSTPSSYKLFLLRSTWTISRFMARMLAISCAAWGPSENP